MMKTVIFAMLMLILVCLASCGFFSGQNVKTGNTVSTDLNAVEISGMTLGLNVNDVDLLQFTPSLSEIPLFDYIFEEIRLKIDENGNIAQITANSVDIRDENGDIVQIEGVSVDIGGRNFDSLEEIKSELGEHFHEYWFDWGQNMMAITYSDRENGIALTLVYIKTNNLLIWSILSMI